MLSPITATNVRVEERDRRDQPRQDRPRKRKKQEEDNHPHEENRGEKVDLTA